MITFGYADIYTARQRVEGYEGDTLVGYDIRDNASGELVEMDALPY